jgi:hypothetical protein
MIVREPTMTAGSDARVTPMLWVSWRLQRGALLVAGAAAAAFATVLVVRGLQIHSVFGLLARDHCDGPGPGPQACSALAGKTGSASTIFGPAALTAFPVLIGMFVGAPMFARDFETGTQRFAFTQGTNRGRWVAGRMTFAGIACTAVAAALGLLASWWVSPFRSPDAGPWWPGQALTMVTPVLLAGWTLLGLITGAALGMLIRRTVLAMAAAGAAVGVLAGPVAGLLRGALLSIDPVAVRTTPGVLSVCGTTCTQSVPPPGTTVGIWVHAGYTVGGWFTRPGGHLVSAAQANSIVAHMPQKIATSDRVAGWLAAHHLVYWLAYQPGSRYWVFQFAEFGALLAAAGLLAGLTVTMVRRRAA